MDVVIDKGGLDKSSLTGTEDHVQWMKKRGAMKVQCPKVWELSTMGAFKDVSVQCRNEKLPSRRDKQTWDLIMCGVGKCCLSLGKCPTKYRVKVLASKKKADNVCAEHWEPQRRPSHSRSPPPLKTSGVVGGASLFN